MEAAKTSAIVPAVGKEDDFGGDIRRNRQLVMRAMATSLQRPFDGVEGTDLMPVFGDMDQVGKHFKKALLDRAGLNAIVFPKCAERRGMPLVTIDDKGTEAEGAPFETVLIMGSMPAGAAAGVQDAQRTALERVAGIVEASAEFVRVLLEGAIIEAQNDCDLDENVILAVREIDIAQHLGLDTGKISAAVRVRASVICDAEPRLSYLMGTAWGEPKAHELAWEIPFVEYFYGPNRLRWMDKRSTVAVPDMVKPATVVAS